MTDEKHPDFPIDWTDLYNRIGDEEIIGEFATAFLKNGDKLIVSLNEAVESGDPDQIELYAHALKGAASNIGAIELAKASWLLEKTAAEKHVEKAADLFNAIRPAYQLLSDLLQQPDWIVRAKNAAAVHSG